jgi:hypothetical protein
VTIPESRRRVTFRPSTAAAPQESLTSPSPSETPKRAEAGIVVTEIPTPTAAAARVSKESIAATPAASATSTVE